MGKDFSPGPLSRKVEGSKLRQRMDRARDAAPLAIEQIQRRLGRAVATARGTARKEVIRENADLLLRAAREMRDGVTDLNIGDLMVKSEWQKLDDQTKQAYLDYIANNQPGNTPEVRAANGEAAVAMFNEIMNSPMPEGVDLSQQAAPDRFVPAVAGGRKTVPLGSEEAEQRTRLAIPEEKRASTIVGTAEATKMRQSVADPAPVDRQPTEGDPRRGLPTEVQQQEYSVNQAIEAKKLPVTRRTTEQDLKRTSKATAADLRKAKRIPELRQQLAELIDADIERRAQFLGGTEPGLDVAPGEYASAGTVPVAPIDAPQQVRESMIGIDTQGNQVFRDVADPVMRELTPEQRRAYIRQMDPTMAIPEFWADTTAPGVAGALAAERSPRGRPLRMDPVPRQLNTNVLLPQVLAGQPDAPGVRVMEGQVPANLSVSPRIARLVSDISRLEKPGAEKFLTEKLARIREQMKPGATSNEFLVKPFSENTRDIYNVLEFSDAPQERFNRYVMQMLDIPAEALYGLGRADAGTGMDPSGAQAIMERAMERGGFTTPRKTPQRREVVPFDLDYVLPELTNSNWEMALKATDSYTPENIAYLVADKMRLGPQQFEIVADQLIPRVEQAMRARDDARRIVANPPEVSGLPSARQSPPPPFSEFLPSPEIDFLSQQRPLLAGELAENPGAEYGNIGAYATKGRSPQTPGYVGILNPDELQALDERLIAMADEALQGGEGTIQSMAPNQYGVFLPESQTPVRIINAEDIAKQIYDERDAALIGIDADTSPFGLDADAMEANAALNQLSDELGGLDFDGALAEPAGSLEDIGGQSVVESAPIMGDVNDSLAGGVDNAEDLVGTGVSMDELAPAAPPLGDAPSAAEVSAAVANDGELTFTQPPAAASVAEATGAVAEQATPQASGAVEELIAAAQPINADVVANPSVAPTSVIRELAQTATTAKPKGLKLLEAEARGLRKQLAGARKKGDQAASAALEAAVAAKDREVLAAVNASTDQVAPPAAPIGTAATTQAATGSVTPPPSPAVVATGSQATTTPTPRPAPSAPGSPAPAPTPAQAAAAPAPAPAATPTPQMTLEEYLSLGRELGFEQPTPFTPGSSFGGFTDAQAFRNMMLSGSEPVLDPADPPPKTWLNLPGRALGGTAQYVKQHPYRTAAGVSGATLTALAVANANRTPEPQAEPMGLTDEEKRLLQDYDARRGSPMQANPQPSLNPQQPMRGEDRLRMLLQPRP